MRLRRRLGRGLPHGLERPVRLGGHVEIAFREPLDLMGPDLDRAFSPGHVQVRMVPLLLRDRADLVGELERLDEVLERIGPLQMSFGVQLPARLELWQHRFRARPFHRRHAPPARHAWLIGKTHAVLPSELAEPSISTKYGGIPNTFSEGVMAMASRHLDSLRQFTM